jgi:hypothetical protein
MRLLVVSFYYSPDLAAGSFRATALVAALRERATRHAYRRRDYVAEPLSHVRSTRGGDGMIRAIGDSPDRPAGASQ